MNPALHRLALCLLLLSAAALPSCGIFSAMQQSPTVPVASQYTGLAGKSVAIVIYTQQATIDEFSGAREEISNFLVRQFQLHAPSVRLLAPADVIKWQNNTLNWYGMPERDIGKHFSVDRVLYVEVLDYASRRSSGYADLQGHLKATCKVIEVDSESPRAAWTGRVDVSWPADRPLDPTQTNENLVRQHTLEVFSDRLVKYFYDHDELRVPTLGDRN